MRLDLIKLQAQKQQGQPVWDSQSIGLSNAIYWRQMRLKHEPLTLSQKDNIHNQIKHMQRNLDILKAFEIN